MTTFEQHVRARTPTREEIDHFLDPEKLSWGQFDPEVGYILGNYLPRDGIDNSATINTVQKNGTRSGVLYADRPRRINTYGNSFTQGAQVSDEETWQEYLAAHLGEPIGNYGVGGFGVYQAYRRLMRAEATDEGAEYVILYIWGDDHHRSFLRCRRVSYPIQRSPVPAMFEGNFWAHLEMDMENGHLVEEEALLQTPESLYNMTDPDFMYEALKDDLMLQMSLFCRDYIQEIDIKPLKVLAEILGFSPDVSDQPKQQRRWIENLRHTYAFAGTCYIIEQALAFTQHRGKKLMIALYCPHRSPDSLSPPANVTISPSWIIFATMGSFISIEPRPRRRLQMLQPAFRGLHGALPHRSLQPYRQPLLCTRSKILLLMAFPQTDHLPRR